MSKYNIDDKVVIRKGLEHLKVYGDVEWWSEMDYLKEKEYVVIEKIDEDGDYVVEDGWYISEEMISGLYEEKDMSIEDLKKQIEGYFSNLIDDFKGELKKTLNSEHSGITLNKDMVNEAFMINVKEKENRVNELVLKILELNHDIKLSIGGK